MANSSLHVYKLSLQYFACWDIWHVWINGLIKRLSYECCVYVLALSTCQYWSVVLQELSDMTAIKAEDILTTLQSLELIQYRKGQHVICADPKVLDRHLKAAGRGGLDVDVCKLIWTPYKEQSWSIKELLWCNFCMCIECRIGLLVGNIAPLM